MFRRREHTGARLARQPVLIRNPVTDPSPFLPRYVCALISSGTRPADPTIDDMVKRSPEEQAQRAAALLGKAARLQQASMAGKVLDIMKKKPDLARPIFEYAQRLATNGAPRHGQPENLAITDGAVDSASAGSSSGGTQQQQEQQQQQRSDLCAPPSGKKQKASLDTLMQRPIDRQSYRIELLPVLDLKNILYSLHTATFTEWTLRSLLRPGQRDVSRTALCELIEFLSGVPGNSALSNTYWPKVHDLAMHLQALSRSFGDRATSLTMPPDWDDYQNGDGIYKLTFDDDGEIGTLTHRFADKQVQFDRSDFAWTDPNKIHLDLNFSDSRANLRCDGCVNTKNCANLFLEKGIDTKPKGMLALPAPGPKTPSKRPSSGAPSSVGGSSKKPRPSESDMASQVADSDALDQLASDLETPVKNQQVQNFDAEAANEQDAVVEASFQPPIPAGVS